MTAVHFKDGNLVNKGDVLFTIDPRTFESQLAQAQANMARSTALLHQAEANLQRDTAQERYSRDLAGRYAKLFAEGVTVRNVRVREPELEEVFVELAR